MEEIDAWGDALHDRKIKAAKEKEKELMKSIHVPMQLSNDNANSEGISFIRPVINKITLGCMLTILDGIRPLSGSIIIMTTNCIEILDEALLRDGRIDAIIELGKINTKNLIKMISKNFPTDNVNIDGYFDKY